MIQFLASILMAQMPSSPSAPPLPHTALPEARHVPPPPVWWLPWAIGLLVIVLLALIIWLLIKPSCYRHSCTSAYQFSSTSPCGSARSSHAHPAN